MSNTQTAGLPFVGKLEPLETSAQCSNSSGTDYVSHEIHIKTKPGTGVAIGLYDPSQGRPSSLLVCTNPKLGNGTSGSSAPLSGVEKIKWGDQKQSQFLRLKDIHMFEMEPGVYSVAAEEGGKLNVGVFSHVHASDSDDGKKGSHVQRNLTLKQEHCEVTFRSSSDGGEGPVEQTRTSPTSFSSSGLEPDKRKRHEAMNSASPRPALMKENVLAESNQERASQPQQVDSPCKAPSDLKEADETALGGIDLATEFADDSETDDFHEPASAGVDLPIKILDVRTSSGPFIAQANEERENKDKKDDGLTAESRILPKVVGAQSTKMATDETSSCHVVIIRSDEAVKTGVKVPKSKPSESVSQQTVTQNNSVLRPFCRLICHQCGKSFKNRGSLQTHQRIHSGEKPFQCEECGVKFLRKHSLQLHCYRFHSSKRPFRCGFCPKGYVRKKDLVVHLRSHSGERPFPCKDCGRAFRRNETLKHHRLRVHTPEDLFKCQVCDKGFVRRSYLKVHERKHTGEKPFGCDQCNQHFERKEQVEGHKIKDHGTQIGGPGQVQCEKCGKYFSSQRNLDRHQLRLHSGAKPFECDQCHKRFAVIYDLKTHYIVHEGARFSCQYCEKSYTQKGALELHMRNHSGEKPFSCDECDKAFKRKDYLQIHKMRKHGEDAHSSTSNSGSGDVHVCEVCSRKFRWKCKLKIHMRTHTREFVYMCDKCDSGFHRKDSLMSHQMRVHEVDSPYLCHHCGQRFSQSSNYRTHLNIHTKAQQFKCDHELCGKVFNRKDSLLKHKKTHNSEYFICEVCNKRYRLNGKERHMKRHNGEKPFNCDYCEMAFRLRCQLTRHERTHTGEKPYWCNECNRQFARKDQLNSHWRRAHSKIMIST